MKPTCFFSAFRRSFYRLTAAVIGTVFTWSTLCPPPNAFAQPYSPPFLNLSVPGATANSGISFQPAVLQGVTVFPDNPLRFDFVLDRGDSVLDDSAFREEARKLIKYFLAALTVPEDEMWVNLSPYEKDRVIPSGFGETEMGRDLLAQDYLLKQMTAALMHPDQLAGQAFWDKVHSRLDSDSGIERQDMARTFHKIWIVPDEAVVYEHQNSAFVVESRLKVMLESDYRALRHLGGGGASTGFNDTSENDVQDQVSAAIRQYVIPEIQKEVNEGETFSGLRQIFNALVLASWYKQNLRQSLLGQIYVDQQKTRGIDFEDKAANQRIYQDYLKAFERGVTDLIREEYDPARQEIVTRQYFTGGFSLMLPAVKKIPDFAMLTVSQQLGLERQSGRSTLIVDLVPFDHKVDQALLTHESGVLAMLDAARNLFETTEGGVRAAVATDPEQNRTGVEDARDEFEGTDSFKAFLDRLAAWETAYDEAEFLFEKSEVPAVATSSDAAMLSDFFSPPQAQQRRTTVNTNRKKNIIIPGLMILILTWWIARSVTEFLGPSVRTIDPVLLNNAGETIAQMMGDPAVTYSENGIPVIRDLSPGEIAPRNKRLAQMRSENLSIAAGSFALTGEIKRKNAWLGDLLGYIKLYPDFTPHQDMVKALVHIAARTHSQDESGREILFSAEEQQAQSRAAEILSELGRVNRIEITRNFWTSMESQQRFLKGLDEQARETSPEFLRRTYLVKIGSSDGESPAIEEVTEILRGELYSVFESPVPDKDGDFPLFLMQNGSAHLQGLRAGREGLRALEMIQDPVSAAETIFAEAYSHVLGAATADRAMASRTFEKLDLVPEKLHQFLLKKAYLLLIYVFAAGIIYYSFEGIGYFQPEALPVEYYEFQQNSDGTQTVREVTTPVNLPEDTPVDLMTLPVLLGLIVENASEPDANPINSPRFSQDTLRLLGMMFNKYRYPDYEDVDVVNVVVKLLGDLKTRSFIARYTNLADWPDFKNAQGGGAFKVEDISPSTTPVVTLRQWLENFVVKLISDDVRRALPQGHDSGDDHQAFRLLALDILRDIGHPSTRKLFMDLLSMPISDEEVNRVIFYNLFFQHSGNQYDVATQGMKRGFNHFFAQVSEKIKRDEYHLVYLPQSGRNYWGNMASIMNRSGFEIVPFESQWMISEEAQKKYLSDNPGGDPMQLRHKRSVWTGTLWLVKRSSDSVLNLEQTLDRLNKDRVFPLISRMPADAFEVWASVKRYLDEHPDLRSSRPVGGALTGAAEQADFAMLVELVATLLVAGFGLAITLPRWKELIRTINNRSHGDQPGQKKLSRYYSSPNPLDFIFNETTLIMFFGIVAVMGYMGQFRYEGVMNNLIPSESYPVQELSQKSDVSLTVQSALVEHLLRGAVNVVNHKLSLDAPVNQIEDGIREAWLLGSPESLPYLEKIYEAFSGDSETALLIARNPQNTADELGLGGGFPGASLIDSDGYRKRLAWSAFQTAREIIGRQGDAATRLRLAGEVFHGKRFGINQENLAEYFLLWNPEIQEAAVWFFLGVLDDSEGLISEVAQLALFWQNHPDYSPQAEMMDRLMNDSLKMDKFLEALGNAFQRAEVEEDPLFEDSSLALTILAEHHPDSGVKDLANQRLRELEVGGKIKIWGGTNAFLFFIFLIPFLPAVTRFNINPNGGEPLTPWTFEALTNARFGVSKITEDLLMSRAFLSKHVPLMTEKAKGDPDDGEPADTAESEDEGEDNANGGDDIGDKSGQKQESDFRKIKRQQVIDIFKVQMGRGRIRKEHVLSAWERVFVKRYGYYQEMHGFLLEDMNAALPSGTSEDQFITREDLVRIYEKILNRPLKLNDKKDIVMRNFAFRALADLRTESALKIIEDHLFRIYPDFGDIREHLPQWSVVKNAEFNYLGVLNRDIPKNGAVHAAYLKEIADAYLKLHYEIVPDGLIKEITKNIKKNTPDDEQKKFASKKLLAYVGKWREKRIKTQRDFQVSLKDLFEEDLQALKKKKKDKKEKKDKKLEVEKKKAERPLDRLFNEILENKNWDRIFEMAQPNQTVRDRLAASLLLGYFPAAGIENESLDFRWETAVEVLEELFSDEVPEVIGQSLISLGLLFKVHNRLLQARIINLVPEIARQLEHSDAQVRIAAAKALELISYGNESRKALLKALQVEVQRRDVEYEVVEAIMKALIHFSSTISDDEAKRIGDVVEHSPLGIRQMIFKFLRGGTTRDMRFFFPLLISGALADTNDERQSIAEALEKIRTDRSYEDLQKLPRESRHHLRKMLTVHSGASGYADVRLTYIHEARNYLLNLFGRFGRDTNYIIIPEDDLLAAHAAGFLADLYALEGSISPDQETAWRESIKGNLHLAGLSSPDSRVLKENFINQVRQEVAKKNVTTGMEAKKPESTVAAPPVYSPERELKIILRDTIQSVIFEPDGISGARDDLRIILGKYHQHFATNDVAQRKFNDDLTRVMFEIRVQLHHAVGKMGLPDYFERLRVLIDPARDQPVPVLAQANEINLHESREDPIGGLLTDALTTPMNNLIEQIQSIQKGDVSAKREVQVAIVEIMNTLGKYRKDGRLARALHHNLTLGRFQSEGRVLNEDMQLVYPLAQISLMLWQEEEINLEMLNEFLPRIRAVKAKVEELARRGEYRLYPIVVEVEAGKTLEIEVIDTADSAMISSEFEQTTQSVDRELGGIDLNPALLNLKIQRGGDGLPLPLEQQPALQIPIEGFIPVIINILPVTNMPLLLGIAEPNDAPGYTHHQWPDDSSEELEKTLTLSQAVLPNQKP